MGWLDDTIRAGSPPTAPAATEAGYWPHASDTAADQDLKYLSDAAYAERVATRLTAHTASAAGSTVLGSGGTHVVSFATTAGYRYELIVRAVSEDGSSDIDFDEERVVIATNVGGTAAIKDNTIAYSNFATNWTLAMSVSTANVVATLTNSTASERGCSIAFEVGRIVAIPAAP